jgi:hypothetical protein
MSRLLHVSLHLHLSPVLHVSLMLYVSLLHMSRLLRIMQHPKKPLLSLLRGLCDLQGKT